MMVHQHLSSAHELLNLAHTQAKQMLSLAYQQAQQVLVCDQRQQSQPPSLVSKCKAHHRPACSLAPCSNILYKRSKVTCEKLHAELVKNSWHWGPVSTPKNIRASTIQQEQHPLAPSRPCKVTHVLQPRCFPLSRSQSSQDPSNVPLGLPTPFPWTVGHPWVKENIPTNPHA